jgi:hypothetical protein
MNENIIRYPFRHCTTFDTTTRSTVYEYMMLILTREQVAALEPAIQSQSHGKMRTLSSTKYRATHRIVRSSHRVPEDRVHGCLSRCPNEVNKKQG